MNRTGNWRPRKILEMEGIRVRSMPPGSCIDLSLEVGEFAFLKAPAMAAVLVGLAEPAQGTIRYREELWEEFSVRELERLRRRIGIVFSAHQPGAAAWVANLNIEENVRLGPAFERRGNPSQIGQKKLELAAKFGFVDGLPLSRPISTPAGHLIRAQWVRALLPTKLDLLILESPLLHAPQEHVPAFVNEVKQSLTDGVAVLWVEELSPSFDDIGLKPDHWIEPNLSSSR